VFRFFEQFAHAQVERGTAEFERIIQGAVDFDIKPAVDPAPQEIEREAVDHQDRDDGQTDEHDNEAQGQARAVLASPELTHQAPYVDRDQGDERQQADGIED